MRIDGLAADLRWESTGCGRWPTGPVLPLDAAVHTGPAGRRVQLVLRRPGFFGAAETRLAERFAREATVAVGIAARMAA